MIAVHGDKAEAGGGTRDERRVLLSPKHIVSVLNNDMNRTLIVSQSQSKEGSIMIAVEESQEQVAILLAFWKAFGWHLNLDDGGATMNVAAEWRDGRPRMIQETISDPPRE